MSLKEWLFEREDQQFDVVCVDETAQTGLISKGTVYKVLGVLQGFFIMKNDKKNLDKFYRDRFKIRGEE